MDAITSDANLIEMRDVTARFEELRTELFTDGGELWPGMEGSEEQAEYQLLQRLLNDTRARGNEYQWEGHWYPRVLIRDTHFVEWAQQYAQDIAAVAPTTMWPYEHIDWDRAAESLRQDFSSLEFDCVTYWHRS